MAYGNVDAASVAPQLAPPSSPVSGGPPSVQLAPLSAPNESRVDGLRLSVTGALSGARSTLPVGSLVEVELRQPLARSKPNKASEKSRDPPVARLVMLMFPSRTSGAPVRTPISTSRASTLPQP